MQHEAEHRKQNNAEHNVHQNTQNISQCNLQTNSQSKSKKKRVENSNEPFDQRGIQTYSSLDEVLPKVTHILCVFIFTVSKCDSKSFVFSKYALTKLYSCN